MLVASMEKPLAVGVMGAGHVPQSFARQVDCAIQSDLALLLIVEFANQRYAAGMPLVKATLEAARLRFRPIIMTSMAFILGVLPLVLASGAGAASRHSIGTGVFGGMLAATFLAIFFVPLFFVISARLSRKAKSSG
jgi:HAE1 family hydrophobic/amphiphilic exporter-1/multidrug efflux pump